MSTHVIIDGYNLLGATRRRPLGLGHDVEAARERLLQDLVAYRQRVGHVMTVVFDAYKQPGGIQQHEHRAGLTVIFSKHGEQADQVIQRMVRAQSQGCIVVSSDHEIMDTARVHGALVLRAQEFLVKLRGPSDSSTSHKRFHMNEKDDSELTRRPDKKGNPRKLPKAARQRLRNLKKL
mgnify:CR=1 FL=1